MIRIQDLSKTFAQNVAVNHLSLDVQEGDLFGFIGPNGAGKTTTMRILATLQRPSSGTAMVGGFDVVNDRMSVRRIMGFMPDHMGMYDEMTVLEYLEFYAALYLIPREERTTLIGDLLALVNFTKSEDRRVGTLSKGERQILALAKTLVHRPKVLILDEPAEGLDPGARIELRETLKELQRMGKTIFISSHILTELADLCNRFAIIERGRLVVAGETEKILAQFSSKKSFEIDVESEAERAAQVVAGLGTGFTAMTVSPTRIEAGVEGGQEEVAKLIAALNGAGLSIRSVKEKKVNLEDLFMQLTQGDVG